MGGETLKRALSIFKHELRDTAVVKIGHAQKGDEFFTRDLHIVKDMHGRTLKPMRLRNGSRRTPAAAE
jgi:ABC-type uncharacterized transport system fused permease/ATPase subunit